jgi:hypothetical protein
MVEQPTQDLHVPPEAMREEEQNNFEDEEDHDSLEDHENEEEQPNTVLFTPKQLEVLLKMNKPDFNELVAAFKGVLLLAQLERGCGRICEDLLDLPTKPSTQQEASWIVATITYSGRAVGKCLHGFHGEFATIKGV